MLSTAKSTCDIKMMIAKNEWFVFTQIYVSVSCWLRIPILVSGLSLVVLPHLHPKQQLSPSLLYRLILTYNTTNIRNITMRMSYKVHLCSLALGLSSAWGLDWQLGWGVVGWVLCSGSPSTSLLCMTRCLGLNEAWWLSPEEMWLTLKNKFFLNLKICRL